MGIRFKRSDISEVWLKYRVVFFYWFPLNLAKSQSLYKIPYFNFFSRILLLVLGLSQIQGGEVKKHPVDTVKSLGSVEFF